MADVPESHWHPLELRNGSLSEIREVCRTVHTMNDAHHAFVFVSKQALLEEQEQHQLEIFVDCEPGNAVRGRYLYRAIAANWDEQQWNVSQIVHWHSQRGEDSENRIKKFLLDFAGGQLRLGRHCCIGSNKVKTENISI